VKNFCHEASRLISDSCDRNLTIVEQIELRFHLLACSFCRDQKHNAHLMEEILSKIQNEDPDLGLSLSQSERETIRIELEKLTTSREPPAASS